MYSTCTIMYIQKFIVHGINNVYTHTYCFSIHVCEHICIALVHAMDIPGTYIKCTKTYFLVHVLEKQKLQEGRIEPRISHRVSSSLNHCASNIGTLQFIVMIYVYCSTWRLVTYVWCRNSRPTRPRHNVAGRASTWISLKPRPAVKQGLEARMWRRTPARWRKSPRLEMWLVAVQLTPCRDRLTGPAPDSQIGGPGPVALQPACWSQ